MSKKNFLDNSGTEDDNKVIENIQPDDLVGLFDKIGLIPHELSTQATHVLNGKQNLIIVTAPCTIILPKAVLFTGELAVKISTMGITVTVVGDSSSETIDGYPNVQLNNIGITIFGSTSLKWYMTQYR